MFLQGYGIRYIRGCWGVGAGYEREGIDNRLSSHSTCLGLAVWANQSQFFGRALFGEPRAEYQHPEAWILSR